MIGMMAASLARHLWRWPITVSAGKILAYRYIFLITSTLSPSEKPLLRSAKRNIFSTEERLDQMLSSIASVRAKVPGALIVLLENSDLTDKQAQVLRDTVDWLVLFAHDPKAVVFRDCSNRGSGEIYKLQSIHRVLRNFDYQLLFKLSGRYCLSRRFALEHFPRDRFGFLLRDGVASTRLYSVPGCLHDQYGRQLTAAFVASRFGLSIESAITCGLTSHQVQWLDPIGVSGHVAVDGMWIDE